MKDEDLTDELNVQKVTFSQFIRTLYGCLTTDYDDVHFMIELVNHSLKDDTESVLSERGQNGTSNIKNYKRFLQLEENSSFRNFPREKAEDILNSFSKDNLTDFLDEILNDIDNEDSAQSLKDALFYSNDDVTCVNIAEYTASLFQQILQSIKIQKQSRISKKRKGTEVRNSSPQITHKDYENKIRTLLDWLFSSNTEKELKNLRMLPVDIKKKIKGNAILEEKISNLAIKYYRYIREVLLVKQEENPCNFEYLASEVSEMYRGFNENTKSQDEIFDKITESFMNTTRGKIGRATSEILTSFFVQNCEVFDVIAK